PRFIWSPIEASGPVMGPATAMTRSSASAGAANAVRATPASDRMTILRMIGFSRAKGATLRLAAGRGVFVSFAALGLTGKPRPGNHGSQAPQPLFVQRIRQVGRPDWALAPWV